MKFKCDINLDCESEEFLRNYALASYRWIAKQLGFKGKGSFVAAQALKHYAWNKLVATKLRREGNIQGARKYEAICDRIYQNTIQPFIECW